MAEFVMPSLGADMDAGTLVAWMKPLGALVRRGEILAEVETDKGVIAVESFHDGVLTKTLVSPGEKVAVGTVLAILEGAPEAQPTVAAAEVPDSSRTEPRTPPVSAVAPAPAPAPAVAASEVQADAQQAPASTRSAPAKQVTVGRSAAARVRITPYALRRAAELGVAVGSLTGTGPDGAIVARDVARQAPAGEAPAPPTEPVRRDSSAPPREALSTEHPLTPEQRMRRAIGAVMVRSKREIPHYYVAQTIDLGPALERLTQHNTTVSVNDRVLPAALLLRAAVMALAKVPELNAHSVNGDAPTLSQVDLGVAISLRKGGLVAPPVVDAGSKTLVEIMQALDELVRRARRGRLTASELRGGTITVTSLGDRGVESVYPIIYPPQVAIVGFGKIATRPWVVDSQVLPRPVVTATLGADHRFTDGRRGAVYLAAIEELLSSPEALFCSTKDASNEP